MKKYYLGFLVLIALTVGLLGFTVYQGTLAKQDKKTQKRAVAIAEDLNSYISVENKIPSSLKAADIDNVPEEISYKKLDDERYRFCVTYKTASRGYGVGSWELATVAFMQSYYGSGDYSSDYEDSSLYMYEGSSHTKGENCQTVKPYLSSYDDSSLDDYTLPSTSSFCDPDYEYYDYYKDYCEQPSDTDDTDTLVN